MRVLLADPRFDVNARTMHGWTQLHWAVIYSPDIMRMLLRHPGIDVNITQMDLWRPLHFVALKPCERAVRILIADGRVDVNAQGPEGRTALMMAVSDRSLGVLDALLSDPRVDVNLGDHHGGSPLHLAARMRDVSVLRRL
ncbi:ankyrin, partial [Choiromyces venosus 120613-1]